MTTQVGNPGATFGATYVCGSSFVSSGTVTATSESSGYAASNIMGWLPAQRWLAANSASQNVDIDLGAAFNADCWGVYKHNLGDVAGSLLVQYSTGSAGGPFTTLHAITPGNNRALFRVNTVDITARYWRLVCSGHIAAPTIAVAVIGKAIQLPAPHHPFNLPLLSRDTEVMNMLSEAGEPLGRSVLRQGLRTGLKYGQMQVSWARATWEPFIRLAEKNPFFFSYDQANYPDEAYYCFLDKKPKYGQTEKPIHVQVEATFIAKA